MDISLLLRALVPTAALLGLGWALRKHLNFKDAFWVELERLTYYFLLPALFISSLATANLTKLPAFSMVGVIIVSSVVGGLLLLPFRKLAAGNNGPAFTSVYQGAVRFNNYIGLVLATTLFGADGLALAALANAALVPTVNITSTLVFAQYGSAKVQGWAIVRAIYTNPLVVACFVGLALNLSGLWFSSINDDAAAATSALAAPLVEILKILGQAALPIGLLCVGAGLRATSLRGFVRPMLWASFFRFVIIPTLALVLCLWAGLTGPAAAVIILFQSIPTASSAYVLSRRLGGDSPLMAAIIATQTASSFLTIPVWIALTALFVR